MEIMRIKICVGILLCFLVMFNLFSSSNAFNNLDCVPKIDDVILGSTGFSGHVFNVDKDDYFYMQITLPFKDGSFAVINAPIDRDGHWKTAFFEYEDVIYLHVTDRESVFGRGDHYVYDTMKIDMTI